MEIPGYEILEKLGEGGTATVWKARQIALDRPVALKILNHATASDPEGMERFHTEGLAAAKLSHRNIVQVFDAGEVGGVPYFAMEYVEGQSLGDVIARKGKLESMEALAVAESVAVALKHAWSRAQITHCDIKPDNILIEKYGVVKVADLGLARIISHREGHPERDVIGTPNYVSPEQAQGGIELDYRSDIYSLGATLYHMVTGVMPFAGATGAAAMDMHISQYLHDAMEINPSVPANVAWLIEKMMVRNRGDRYASWSEVIDDIDRVTNGNLPLPPLPEHGQSTVVRCAARQQAPAPEPARAAPPPQSEPQPVPAARQPEPEIFEEESPNIAVDPTKMRAKLSKVMDKHQATPVKPGNIILQVAIFAGVAVLAYWLINRMNHPEPTQKKTDAISVDDPMHSVIHQAGQDSDVQPATPGAAANPGALNPATATPVGTYVPVQYTSNQLKVVQNKANMSWDDAEYQRAAAMYNNALIAYGNYQDTRENPAVLKRCEANLKIALEYFEKCKDRAPKKYDVDALIQKCNKLLFDVHASTQLQR